MEKAALQGTDGASEVSLAGNSDTAADAGGYEQSRIAEEITSYPRESILQFELVRGVSLAGSALQQHCHPLFCGELHGEQP